MRFGIVTLFPEMLGSFLEAGLLHKAIELPHHVHGLLIAHRVANLDGASQGLFGP